MSGKKSEFMQTGAAVLKPKRHGLNELSFKVTERELEVISRIVTRACRSKFVNKWCAPLDGEALKQVLLMDICATHATLCRLRLMHLLECRQQDFCYDVVGIHKYLDRETGMLKDGWKPRCAEF